MFSFSRLLSVFALLSVLIGYVPTARAESVSTLRALTGWVIDNAKDKITPTQAVRIVQAAFNEARKQHLDPLLILSVISAESSFKSRAKSAYGARGLMQVVPRWHRDKIKGRSVTDVSTNIEVGTQILQDCLIKNNDHLNKAMRCYSGGASSAYHTRIAKSHRQLQETVLAMQMSRDEPITMDSKLHQPRYWHAQTEKHEYQARQGSQGTLVSFVAFSVSQL